MPFIEGLFRAVCFIRLPLHTLFQKDGIMNIKPMTELARWAAIWILLASPLLAENRSENHSDKAKPTANNKTVEAQPPVQLQDPAAKHGKQPQRIKVQVSKQKPARKHQTYEIQVVPGKAKGLIIGPYRRIIIAQEVEAQDDDSGKAAPEAPRYVIGVRLEKIPEALSVHMKLEPESGMMVTSVAKEGPAAKAGIQKFDLITKINGQKAADHQIPQLLQQAGQSGKSVTLTIISHGEEKQIEITPVRQDEIDWGLSELKFNPNHLKEMIARGKAKNLTDDEIPGFIELLEILPQMDLSEAERDLRADHALPQEALRDMMQKILSGQLEQEVEHPSLEELFDRQNQRVQEQLEKLAERLERIEKRLQKSEE